jgi:hypothetical protein
MQLLCKKQIQIANEVIKLFEQIRYEKTFGYLIGSTELIEKKKPRKN